VHYIHTSGASMVGDWPETGGRVDTTIHSDLDDIYSLEKNFPESFSPVREVDLFVVEFGESKEVNTYIIPPPLIFGRGTGLFTEGVGQVHMMTQLALKKEASRHHRIWLGNLEPRSYNRSRQSLSSSGLHDPKEIRSSEWKDRILFCRKWVSELEKHRRRYWQGWKRDRCF